MSMGAVETSVSPASENRAASGAGRQTGNLTPRHCQRRKDQALWPHPRNSA